MAKKRQRAKTRKRSTATASAGSGKRSSGKAKASAVQAGVGRFERLANWTAVLGLWLSGLVLWPGISDVFRLPKLAVLEGSLLLSVLFLALSPVGFSGWRRAKIAFVATLPLLAVAGLSVLWSAHQGHGQVAILNLAIGLVVLLAWSTRALDLERVLSWLIPAATINAAVLLLQYLEIWQPFGLTMSRDRYQLTGFIGNAGEAAMYLAFVPALFAVKAVRDWSLDRRWRAVAVWGVAWVLVSTAILATETVAATMILGVGVVVVFVAVPMSRKVRLGALGLGMLLLAGVLMSPLGARVVEKGVSLGSLDFSALTTGRTDGWMTAADMLAENPVSGVGIGAYSAEFTPTKEKLLNQGVEFFRFHVGLSTFSNAHNEVFEWAAETGWLGVAALVWASFILLRSVRRRGRWLLAGLDDETGTEESSSLKKRMRFEQSAIKSRLESRLELGLLAATLVWLVVATMAYFPFRTALLAYPLVFILASLLSRDGADPSEAPIGASGDGDSSGFHEGSRLPPWVRWVSAVAIVGLLLSSISMSRTRFRASAQLLLAESTARTMALQNRIYPQVLEQAMSPLMTMSEETPWDERLPLAVGSYYLLIREPKQAEEWYLRSMSVAPRPETIFNLGRAKLAQGDRAAAVEFMARAVRLDRLRRRAISDEQVAAEVMKLVPEAWETQSERPTSRRGRGQEQSPRSRG